MNAPHELRARARRWLRWAEEDLALAAATAASDTLVPRGACAWAQQAAEKALKALLVDSDVDPPKSHDLERLNAMLTAPVTVDSSDLRELSRWSMEGRYPAVPGEGTVEDARLAVDTARRVVSEVADRLPVQADDGP